MASFESTPSGSTPSVYGIFFSVISPIHSLHQRLYLSAEWNGPIYDTKAAETRALPIMVILSCSKVLTFLVQRTFSSARPLTRRLASERFKASAFASSSTACFFATASANYLLSPSTFSTITLTFSRTTLNSSSFSLASLSAASADSISGLTCL